MIEQGARPKTRSPLRFYPPEWGVPGSRRGVGVR